MFRRLKQWLTAWAEEMQRREIARLRHETMELKEKLERETGKPIQLTAEERRLLAEKAEGIDDETLKQISRFLASKTSYRPNPRRIGPNIDS